MKVIFVILLVLISLNSCKIQGKLISIKGGGFINTKSNYYGVKENIPDFFIGKHEVSQKEWVEVMGDNPSRFKGDDLPVESVAWYDCIEFCNKKSLMENLTPYYNIDKNGKDPEIKSDYDDKRWMVTINSNANGYRLPTEAEWEYAAGGGQISKSYTYSGSDKIEDVGYFWQNSGDKFLEGNWNWGTIESNKCRPHRAGSLKPNELGLYDMSGNVREWCWDWYDNGDRENPYQGRIVKGGGWAGSGGYCSFFDRYASRANFASPDLGLRLCRNGKTN